MKFALRLIKYIVVVVVALVGLDFGIIYGAAHYRPKIDHADAIIILGAAINTPALKNRTLEGLRLYQEGKASVMVLSGGKISDDDISEAQYMEKIIKQNTKGEEMPEVILEQSSRNTYENIRNSKEKIPNAKSVIVVSDTFHLARAALTAKAAGFETVYWSAPTPDYYEEGNLRHYYLREMAGMINYLPKFLHLQ